MSTMRTAWKGSLGFGLVNIPVKLHSATDTAAKTVSFRQVHEGCGTRIHQRRICSDEGCPDHDDVPYADIIKGFELPDGEIVAFTDVEMGALPLNTTKQIEVLHFADADELDPIYSAGSKWYYVAPESGGGRAYMLLRDAMRDAGKVAIVKAALRGRESLAVVRIHDNGLMVLQTLLWPDELRPAALPFIDDESLAPREKELTMATALVESMTEPFDPARHTDNYRAAVVAMIEARVSGQAPAVVAVPKPAEESSLLDILAASLRSKQAGPAAAAAAPKRKRAARKSA